MKSIILLHGAIGAPAQLQPLQQQLKENYRVYSFGFSGHGGTPLPEEPLSIKLFADEVLRFMERERLSKVAIFGYSMGGYVAMYLAKNFPAKVSKVITLATKYHWDGMVAAKEIQMMDPEKIEQKVPAFAAALKQLHGPDNWKKLMVQTAWMMVAMGTENPLKPADYQAIVAPVLLLLGDRDKMVTLEETLAVYKDLPDARMGMLPGTAHPIEQVDVDMLCYFIKRFL